MKYFVTHTASAQQVASGIAFEGEVISEKFDNLALANEYADNFPDATIDQMTESFHKLIVSMN